jgi:hypothetical protein
VGHDLECDVSLEGWIALAGVAQVRATASCSCCDVAFVFKEPSSLLSHMSCKASTLEYPSHEMRTGHSEELSYTVVENLVKLGRSIRKMFLGSDFDKDIELWIFRVVFIVFFKVYYAIILL